MIGIKHAKLGYLKDLDPLVGKFVSDLQHMVDEKENIFE